MSIENFTEARQALKHAQEEIRLGRKGQAYWWAARAVRLAPDVEEAWLLLASAASPQASVAYLQRALEINPGSQKASEGLKWALQREEEYKEQVGYPNPQPIIQPPIQPSNAEEEDTTRLKLEARRRLQRKSSWVVLALPYVAALFVVCVVMLGVAFAGVISLMDFPPPAPPQVNLSGIQANIEPAKLPIILRPTQITLPSETPAPLPSFTPEPTEGITETPQPPPTETGVPVVMPTFISLPDLAQQPGINPGNYADPPAASGNHAGRWIDVDLSRQMVYAFEGKKVVRSFVVSTGVAAHPTVTGQYRIWIKLRADDMKGPGYNLKDVPYVMYFYKGYSLHGTYWHHNFGTPMSHGCVNMYTPDAAWIYSWASVGTLVNVHY